MRLWSSQNDPTVHRKLVGRRNDVYCDDPQAMSWTSDASGMSITIDHVSKKKYLKRVDLLHLPC
jgi:hypothetical protein